MEFFSKLRSEVCPAACIDYGFISSPVGNALVGIYDDKLCFLGFHPDHALLEMELDKQFSSLQKVANQEKINNFMKPFPDLDLCLIGSQFQICVWQYLFNLPIGKTLSYLEFASQMGKPSSNRAIATAIGRNPISGIIPCHLVLPSTGEIGKYRWGSYIKKQLIKKEEQQGIRLW